MRKSTERSYVLRGEYTCGVRPLAERGSVALADPTLRDAYNRGETIVVNDLSVDPRFSDGERELLAGRQMPPTSGSD